MKSQDASGQEPEGAIEHHEDFVSLVRVELTVSGSALAKLLKKQDRVLEKTLKDLKRSEALHAALNSHDLLRAVTPAIKRMVEKYAFDNDLEVSDLDVEFADEGDLPYRAKADPKRKELVLELEFDVSGTIE